MFIYTHIHVYAYMHDMDTMIEEEASATSGTSVSWHVFMSIMSALSSNNMRSKDVHMRTSESTYNPPNLCEVPNVVAGPVWSFSNVCPAALAC